MSDIKFIKKTALPATFDANAVYFIKPPGATSAQMWVSDKDGNSVVKVGGDEELDPFLLMGMNNG